MSNQDKVVVPPKSPAKAVAANRVKKPKPFLSIPDTIGTGDDAHHSIVYLTILWCFAAGVCFTIVLWVYRFWSGGTDLIDDFKSIWSTFIPVITLALGYVFGKGQK